MSEVGEYYVYGWFYKNQLVYVGMGKGDRYKHGNSGTSNCYELNQIHFTEGKDKLSSKLLWTGLSREKALKEESNVIDLNKDTLYNSRGIRDDNKFVRTSELQKVNRIFEKKANQYVKDNSTSLKAMNKSIVVLKSFLKHHRPHDIMREDFKLYSRGHYEKLGLIDIANFVGYVREIRPSYIRKRGIYEVIYKAILFAGKDLQTCVHNKVMLYC